METAFIIGRILVGGYFIMSGMMHLTKTNMIKNEMLKRGLIKPKEMTLLSGFIIILAGLGLLLGVFVALSIITLVIFLILASFMIHHFWNDKDTETKMSQRIYFMNNIALAGALLMALAIEEPWLFSIY